MGKLAEILQRFVARHRAASESQGLAIPCVELDGKYQTVIVEYATFLINLPVGGKLQFSWPHVER